MPRVCLNLLFDAVTEQAICTIWQRLAAADAAAGRRPGYRPHITLAVYEDAEPTRYAPVVATIAAATYVFPVRLESLGIFPEAGILFLAPRMSQRLFVLHRQVVHACAAAGSPHLIDDLLLPDRWTPHCTLTGRLTTPQLLSAIAHCQQRWAPIRGAATGIGLRLYPAVDDHQVYAFCQPDNALHLQEVSGGLLC